jgi:predicted kinase
MSKPLIVVFIGFPGSGKTYFATHLARKLNAVVLNSDALRVAMFGSIERMEEIRKTDNSRLYKDVFGAMNYATKQAILAGCSVIYDAQQSKRVDRLRIEALAAEVGAIPVLVWIRTTLEEAKKRGQIREARDDSHVYSEEKMEYLVERFVDTTELPGPGENVIEISGEVSFEEQYDAFRIGLISQGVEVT